MMIQKSNYQEFYGSPMENLPKLLENDMIPLSPRQLMFSRVKEGMYHDVYVDTSAAFVANPKEKCEQKIVLFSDLYLKRILQSYDEIDNLTLEELDKVYGKMSGFVIKKEVTIKLMDDPFSLVHLREKVWSYISEGDNALLNEYKQMVFQGSDSSVPPWMNVLHNAEPRIKFLHPGISGSIDDRMGVFPRTSGISPIRLLRINSIGMKQPLMHPVGDNYSTIEAYNITGAYGRIIAKRT